MSEENKALSRRSIEEVFNAGNLDVVDEIVDPDHVHHDPTMPEEGHGLEHFKQFASMYRSAFPDVHIEIEDQIAEGDKVVSRWVAKGTHQGDLMGIAPTGNRVEAAGMTIDRIAEGKIAETWDNYDALGMMQQLGVIPSPEQAEA
ncbi:MAG: ester cyclase [Actinobacteria bacterium]|nr:ester cyclase [Actinomycetota bacterium]